MPRNWRLVALAAAVVLTGCGTGYLRARTRYHHVHPSCPSGNQGADTTRPARTTTTVSERLAHWRAVVKAMNCAEVTDLELKRLAGDFNDRAESLITIHDRQGELNCA
jgi:hypothetical protein